MVRIEMLPAAHGDAILVDYGSAAEPHRILIDGGPVNAYPAIRRRLAAATDRRKHIDLFVVTHIDTDHIDGAILLLRDTSLGLTFGDIWFNAWDQLAAETAVESFGPLQGEFVASLLHLRNQPWNRAFAGRAAVVAETGPLPVLPLPGGAKLTLLSPRDRQLRRLRRNWQTVVTDAGWQPGDAAASLKRLEEHREYEPTFRRDTFGGPAFGGDNAVANGSTIAFIFEFEGKRCLLAGDAFPVVLAEGLARYATDNRLVGRIPFDAVKVPHHGSKNNWKTELHEHFTSKNFLISTSGAKFRHPDPETIDLILEREPDPEMGLWFNYKSATTSPWKTPVRAKPAHGTSHYAKDGQSITLTLE